MKRRKRLGNLRELDLMTFKGPFQLKQFYDAKTVFPSFTGANVNATLSRHGKQCQNLSRKYVLLITELHNALGCKGP